MAAVHCAVWNDRVSPAELELAGAAGFTACSQLHSVPTRLTGLTSQTSNPVTARLTQYNKTTRSLSLKCNKYGTVQELHSTFSQIKSNIVLRVCVWTCEFVFGLVSSYLDGCDKQKRKKNMITYRVAAQLKIYCRKIKF